MSTLTVYVPAQPTAPALTHIMPGSAIVGSLEPSGMLRIDYEGAAYGQAGLDDFEQRLQHAAGRHARRYPTRARLWLERSDAEALVSIGTYDTDAERLQLEPTAEPILTAWVS